MMNSYYVYNKNILNVSLSLRFGCSGILSRYERYSKYHESLKPKKGSVRSYIGAEYWDKVRTEEIKDIIRHL